MKRDKIDRNKHLKQMKEWKRRIKGKLPTGKTAPKRKQYLFIKHPKRPTEKKKERRNEKKKKKTTRREGRKGKEKERKNHRQK